MRMEARHARGRYIRSVELARNSCAVLFVDELPEVPVDLLATEHGYKNSR